jgi:hypothetical protein
MEGRMLKEKSIQVTKFLLLTVWLTLSLAKYDAWAGEPFKAGERLIYSVEWDPPWYFFFLPRMEAGEIELRLSGETEYNGNNALQISFKAHSSGTLLKLAGVKIDDDFTFLSEPATFCSLKVSKKIQEGKRKRQIDIEYLRQSGQLHIREMDMSMDPPKLRKDETIDSIPECVQDPFSALYFLRIAQLQTGYVRSSIIGHDDKIKEIRSQVETREIIKTPAGKFSAWRVSTFALMGGLFKDGGRFRIWLSADERKMPVQFEAKVHLGSVIGKLKRLP